MAQGDARRVAIIESFKVGDCASVAGGAFDGAQSVTGAFAEFQDDPRKASGHNRFQPRAPTLFAAAKKIDPHSSLKLLSV